MNLDRAVKLLAKLHIKDRDSGTSVLFALNHNQQIAVARMQQQYDAEGYIRVVILKARRLGMSSLIDALLAVYCMAHAQAHAEVVAHEYKTSELGLFRVPHDLIEEVNGRFPIADVRARRIYFRHPAGDSLLDIATAGSVGSGRGLTLNALHLSEASQYPAIGGSFLSLLPAVSKGRDTIVAVESTANGKVEEGEAFYDFWNSACASRRTSRWNGYIPIFLDWLHDPACVRPEEEAHDAPATDLEKELMKKPFHASRAQIAWMRRTLESECQGEEVKFLQEYPHCPEVAFVATGDPAFPREELIYAERSKKEPMVRGRLVRKDDKPWFEQSNRGPLVLWEKPQVNCEYYIGVDAAAGYESGDFACYAIYNGTTGKQAARYDDHSDPEQLGDQCDLAGRWFNRAMINIELTGNLGRWAMKHLRDRYFYPNIARWKGKDDRLSGKARSDLGGWETTHATRENMRQAFREKLRAGMHGDLGGMEIFDAELVQQMSEATLRGVGRWEVRRGHDDILVAWMLACVTAAQFPPTNVVSHSANYIHTQGQQFGHNTVQAALKAQPDLQHALRRDLNMILKQEPVRSIAASGRGIGLPKFASIIPSVLANMTVEREK